MRAVLAWARLDLRRRWWSLVTIVLLVAIGSATVMTAVAGARRGASAQDRLAEETAAADVWVNPNDPDFDWAPFRELPYIEAMAGRVIFEYAGFKGDAIPPGAVAYPAVDASYGTAVEKPVMLEGRWYDAAAVDEAVVSPKFAHDYDKHPGDTVTLALGTPADVFATPAADSTFSGPEVKVRIVGVARSFSLADSEDRPGRFLFSPALVARYADNIRGLSGADLTARTSVNMMVRLAHGRDDIARLRADVARISGRDDVNILDLDQQRDETARPIDFESTALLALAAVAAVASLLVTSQAISRHLQGQVAEVPTGRALGLTPRAALVGTALPVSVAGLVGALAGTGVSVVASSHFPLGRAAIFEPDQGTRADLLVLGLGLAGATVSCVVAALLTTARAARNRRSTERVRPSRLAAAAAHLPLSVALGTRFALQRGPGMVPVRPAISGAVAGVLGLVAMATISTGIGDALAHKERFGQTYDVSTVSGLNGEDFIPPDEAADLFGGLAPVTGLTMLREATATRGAVGVPVWELPTDPEMRPVVLEGRLPTGPDEIALGPTNSDQLGAGVGDAVPLTLAGHVRSVRVVGVALAPAGQTSGYADASWMTADGNEELFDAFEWRAWFMQVREPGPHAVEAVTAAWAAAYPELAPPNGPDFFPPGGDTEGKVLTSVRGFPLALALFLAILAIAALAHAVVLSVRRCGHDIAVARALGMTPGQTGAVFLTQSMVIAAVGVAFGSPLGFAAGRAAWRTIARFTPVALVPPTAGPAMALIATAVLVAACLIAVIPGWRASRPTPAEILRAE